MKKQTSEIDWNDIKHRLEASGAALERRFQLSEADETEILRARAAELARDPKSSVAAEASLEVVEFRLAQQRYALESTFVDEAHRLEQLTPLPCTPPFVLGLASVRGELLSVLNIERLLDLPERESTGRGTLIVVRGKKMEFGILASDVVAVRSIPLRKIQPTLPTLTGIHEEYLKGVTDEGLVILDIEMMLSDERIIVHEDAGAT